MDRRPPLRKDIETITLYHNLGVGNDGYQSICALQVKQLSIPITLLKLIAQNVAEDEHLFISY